MDGSPGRPPATPTVAHTMARVIARALGELGHDASGLIEQTDPDAGVSGEVMDQIWEGAAAELRDDHVALAAVERLPLGTLGALDYGLVTSATLREGLELLCRGFSMVTGRQALTLSTTPDYATLVLSRVPTALPARHNDEFIFGIVTDRMRHALGQRLVLSRVTFTHPRPPMAVALYKYFAAELAFDAGRKSLVFPASLLEQPLRTAQPAVAATIRALLVPGDDEVVATVRNLVAADLAGADFDAVAARLGMPRRTLQRRLSECGTSFRKIVDDARCEEAIALVRSGELDIDRLAARVGFTDATAFYRAFHRWTGMSPMAFAAP